jgi:hypothetical protein
MAAASVLVGTMDRLKAPSTDASRVSFAVITVSALSSTGTAWKLSVPAA